MIPYELPMKHMWDEQLTVFNKHKYLAPPAERQWSFSNAELSVRPSAVRFASTFHLKVRFPK